MSAQEMVWVTRRTQQEAQYTPSEDAKRSKQVLRRWAKDFEKEHTGHLGFGDIKVSLSFAKDARTNWLNKENQHPREWKLTIEWRMFATDAAYGASVWLGWDRDDNASRHTWQAALKNLSTAYGSIEAKISKKEETQSTASMMAHLITKHAETWRTEEGRRIHAEIERAALMKKAKSGRASVSMGVVL